MLTPTYVDLLQAVSVGFPLITSSILGRNIQNDVKNWYASCKCRTRVPYQWLLDATARLARISNITPSRTCYSYSSGMPARFYFHHLECSETIKQYVCFRRYKYLRQPSWKPPRVAFAIVWPILYTLMGTASWLVWHNGGWQKHSAALSMYVIQMALNLAWPPIFFSGHKLGLALADSTGQAMLSLVQHIHCILPLHSHAVLMCPGELSHLT